MGQKVHPIIFRSNNLSLTNSSSCGKVVPDYVYQDKELNDFLQSLLKSRGILLRSCKILRTAQKLTFHLDLYFSYIFSKDAKFSWAKSVFQQLKKKYTKIYKIRDLKSILSSVKMLDESIQCLENSGENKKLKFFSSKLFSLSKKKNFNSSFHFSSGKLFNTTKLQFFFFVKKQKRKQFMNLSTNKAFFTHKTGLRHEKKMSFFCMKPSKFNNLFIPEKTSLFCQDSFLSMYKPFFNSSLYPQYDFHNDLVILNKHLCQSLQNYIGSEQLEIRLSSCQLVSLSSFKEVKKVFLKEKEIGFFEKNKDFSKFFHDTYECCYFIYSTFGKGNAFLLSSFIKIYLESSRKQLLLVKFLQKSLKVFFTSLPSHLRAIDGIKILISGRFNKRRRTKTYLIQEGRILLQTLDSSVDYFQTAAITMFGSFGIKVWISKRHQ